MTDPAGPLAGLTHQDQRLVLGALKSLKSGFEVDYSKLALNMQWMMPDDNSKPNAKKANNAWCATRKKVFPDGLPAATASTAGGPNTKSPMTPRKTDVDGPKTPRAKRTPGKKNLENSAAKEVETDVGRGSSMNGVPSSNQTAADAKIENETKGEAGNAAGHNADADADTTMKDSDVPDPAQNSTVPISGNAAEDMSAGSMSPSAASNHVMQVPSTPKGRATPQTQQSTNGGSPQTVSMISLPDTPTPAPKKTPRKRKTKAEKEKEAESAAMAEDQVTDDSSEGRPVAKKPRSDTMMAKDGAVKSGGADEEDGEDEVTQSTPPKATRRRSAAVLAKKELREREKEAKKAEKEQEKADRKAAKEKEKADKQAAKKATKKNSGNADSSKMPPLSPTTQSADPGPAKSADKEDLATTAAQGQAALETLADREASRPQTNNVSNTSPIDRPGDAGAVNSTVQVEVDQQHGSSTATDVRIESTTEPTVDSFVTVNNDCEIRTKSNYTPDAVVASSDHVEGVEKNDGVTADIAKEEEAVTIVVDPPA